MMAKSTVKDDSCPARRDKEISNAGARKPMQSVAGLGAYQKDLINAIGISAIDELSEEEFKPEISMYTPGRQDDVDQENFLVKLGLKNNVIISMQNSPADDYDGL